MSESEISIIQKKYLLLQQKYSLPEYHLLDKELEISSLDSPYYMLKQIRKKIHHMIEFYSEIIEDLLQPNASIAQMHEYRFFTEKSKEKIYHIYRDLMYKSRNATELGILNDPEKDAEFIKRFFSEYFVIKDEMVKIFTTLKNSWKKELDKDIRVEYFG